MVAESGSSLGNLIWLAVLLAGVVLAIVVLRAWQRSQQRAKNVRSGHVAAAVAPRLGGTFQPEDTHRLVELPFVAFRQWANAGRTISNVATFPGPFGVTSHAFEFDWRAQARDIFGNDMSQFAPNGYHPPDQFACVGALIGLPHPVPTLLVSSFPPRGTQGLSGNSKLRPLVTIPEGTPPEQAFSMRFTVSGHPAALPTLLTPAVVDGLWRGPPGVHVELWDRWLLAISYAPWSGLPTSPPEVVIAEWAEWFAPLVPLDALQAAVRPS